MVELGWGYAYRQMSTQSEDHKKPYGAVLRHKRNAIHLHLRK
jgi:hypothetical protein